MRGLPRVFIPAACLECGNARVAHVMNSVLNKVNVKKNFFKINIRDVPEHYTTDHFNNYFSSVGRNISDSISSSNVSTNFHLRGSFPNNCFLSPYFSDKIYNILVSLNCSRKRKLTVCMFSRLEY